METPFSRLLHFADVEGQAWYGEAPSIDDPTHLVGKSIPVYSGETPWSPDFHATEKSVEIHTILPVITTTPSIQCVGLNYKRHIEETKSKAPAFPVLFMKPIGALAGPFEDIPIHKDAQWLDYEGELCFIIGKKCKDVSQQENPLDYVLGYTIGNDVSSRYWQIPERSSGQAGYSKSFDKFCPLGPYICSKNLIDNPGKLQLTTKVNGEMRQNENTGDLLFDVPEIIRFASRGHTLEPGTVFMTGTPSGVAFGQNPPRWLQDGDVVEIEIEHLGLIRNKMAFEQ